MAWTAETKGLAIRVAGLLVVLVLGGCDDAPWPAGSDGFVTVDSGGVQIAETAGSAARQPVGWVVDATPHLQIGRLEGDVPYTFSTIGTVLELPDRRLLVVDEATREIRLFDPQGRYLEKWGGQGSGPGEFRRAPRIVRWLRKDSLLLFDSQLSRYTVYDPSGGEFRTERPAPNLQTGVILGSVGDKVLVRDAFVRLSTTEGLGPPIDVVFLLSSRATWNRDTIAEFAIQHQYRAVDRESGRGRGYTIPFTVTPTGAVGLDGFFLLTGERPEILEYDTAGALRRILRIAEPVRRVLPEDVERHVRARYAGSSDPAAADKNMPVFRRMPIPEVVPPFRSLMLDDVGWLWAETYRIEQGTTPVWLVFDPAGRARGTVEMPRDLEIHQIGNDFVLGRWRDEFGVEYLRRHRLVREKEEE